MTSTVTAKEKAQNFQHLSVWCLLVCCLCGFSMSLLTPGMQIREMAVDGLLKVPVPLRENRDLPWVVSEVPLANLGELVQWQPTCIWKSGKKSNIFPGRHVIHHFFSFYFGLKMWLQILKQIFLNRHSICLQICEGLVSAEDSRCLPAPGPAQFSWASNCWEPMVHKVHALNWMR